MVFLNCGMIIESHTIHSFGGEGGLGEHKENFKMTLRDIRIFPAIQFQTGGHQTHRRQVLKIQVLGHQLPAARIPLVWKDFWASGIFFPHTF